MTNIRSMIREYAFPLVALFVLCSVHFYLLNRYAMNIAFSDDYNEILRVMNQLLDSQSFSESIQHVMYGVGYSKPLTLRLISLIHLKTLHEINFRYLVFTGNAFLLPVCLIFMISTSHISKLLTVTVSCFVFQPQYWEAIYQATLSNSVFTCLFFSLASFYCITRRKTAYYAIALLCALLAQISFGNGFLVYPILLGIALLYKNIRLFFVILVQMCITTWLYLLGNTVAYKAGENIPFMQKLKLCTVWFFEFLGSSVGYIFETSGYSHEMPASGYSIAIGIFITLFYLYLVWAKYYKRNLLLFAFLTFFVMTAALAAKLRFNSEVPGASRYQIQSALSIVTVICILLEVYSHKLNRYAIWVITILFPILFTLLSYKNGMLNVVSHRTRLISDLINWQTTGIGLTVWSEHNEASRILRQSSNRGIHQIPSRQLLIQKYWKP